MDIIRVFAMAAVVVSAGGFLLVGAFYLINESIRLAMQRRERDALIRAIEYKARFDAEAMCDFTWYANHTGIGRSYGPFATEEGAWAFVRCGTNIEDHTDLERHGWKVMEGSLYLDNVWPVKAIDVGVIEV